MPQDVPIIAVGLVLAILIAPAIMVRAATDQPAIHWVSKDLAGAEVEVPADVTTVITFIRVDQEQSAQALKQIQDRVSDSTPAHVIVVVSGPTAAEQAKAVAGHLAGGWQLVADGDFGASGKMGVHVWPTTLVIKADGTQVAHLAGMPTMFAIELQAYLEYATGKIDDATLQQRLTAHDVVMDTPAQVVARHLRVAERLLEQGYREQAQRELTENVQAVPDDPSSQVILARLDAMLNKPAEAIEILDKLPAGSAPAWQCSLIRARALIGLGRWTDARAIVPEALKQNPDSAEAHYLFGLCYQNDQDWPHAAEQFRLAFEKTAAGSGTMIPAALK